jgi:competence protein ComEA
VPFTLTRTRALVLALCAVAVVVVGGRVLRPAAPRGTAPPLIRAKLSSSRTRAAQLVVVDVAGAVRHAGLYRLPQGSRIADAVARAGGATARAQLDLVNLAAPLADGEQVLVPARGPGVAAAGAGAGPSPTAPVDLNSATIEQLDALPGVGPVTAQKIIDYRQAHGPFRSVDELDAIPGIGPARIENLRGLVVP